MKKQLLSILALLLMAAGGAVAQNTNTVDVRQLTKNADGDWVLNQMPDFNGQLVVTFFEEYKLDSIPLAWTIMVNGEDRTAAVTAYTEGDITKGWLNILEGSFVELIPPVEVKPTVKSVELMEAPAVTNLAELTGDYTAQDGEVLTGTLNGNYKITIADGATVTLLGLTINGVHDDSYQWAGINCLGDATIILRGTNTVKGFHQNYPGIHVPQDKTLTIQGSGSLTASSRGMGCGIGGGYNIAACGNIVIAGGTITAYGGTGAAGIGSGYNVSCGNISITGGTVNANGGNYAAGIGSGYKGQCGTVTITDGVTSVTATKGINAQHSIGAGFNGSCGTVTVGGNTGAKSDSPYTYPAP